MSGQSAGMQIPNQNMYTPQPQSFNQQFGQQQNMGGDIYPRYGQFQNQQQMQQQVQPMQQPNNGLLQTFGGGQLGYRQPMQPQMQQPAQQPAPSLLNQQIPSVQQAPMQQSTREFLPSMPTPPMNTIPLGQGVNANTSIDAYRNSVLQMQNNPRIANIPNYEDWVNSTIYAANQAANPRTVPFSSNQPPNPLRPNIPQPTFTPSPGMPFGGIGGRPFARPVTPEEYQASQDYRNQDLINQAEMLRRMQERMGGGLNPIRAADQNRPFDVNNLNPFTVDTRPINSQDRFNGPFDVNNLNPFSVDTIPFPNRPNVAPRSAPRVAPKPVPRVAPKPAPKPAPRKAPAMAK